MNIVEKALEIFGINDVRQHMTKDLQSIVGQDSGVLNYYRTRKTIFDWIEKQGSERYGGGNPTKKSNALYWYRQAMKFGDLEAAKRYLDRYYELGGTPKRKSQFIRLMHPMSSIKRRKRYAFRQSLTSAQEETLRKALSWYKNTYLKRKNKK